MTGKSCKAVAELNRQDSFELLSTCYHEAGHAVVSAALGRSFDYITLRPKDNRAAAHVMTRSNTDSYYGRWERDGAISAAGILAHDFWMVEEFGYDDEYEYDQNAWRRHLARVDGQDDLRHLRSISWYAYDRSLNDSSWSTTPIRPHWSPVDLAVVAWHRAVLTLAVHWQAVEDVAEVLEESTRKVPYRVVREIVDNAWPDDDGIDEMSEEYLRPWFLAHSRLKWMPSQRWLDDVHGYAERQRKEKVA